MGFQSYSKVIQYWEVCPRALQCCSVLQSVLQCVADSSKVDEIKKSDKGRGGVFLHSSVLQCVASVLQCVCSLCCNVLQSLVHAIRSTKATQHAELYSRALQCCSALQSVLQCVADSSVLELNQKGDEGCRKKKRAKRAPYTFSSQNKKCKITVSWDLKSKIQNVPNLNYSWHFRKVIAPWFR